MGLADRRFSASLRIDGSDGVVHPEVAQRDAFRTFRAKLLLASQ
jgi:hypothetical protein